MSVEKKLVEKMYEAVRTGEERSAVLQGIALLQESLYRRGEAPLHDILHKYFSGKIARLIQEGIPEPHQKHQEAARAFLVYVRGVLDRMRPFKIDLAFEPSEEMAEKLVNFIRTETGEDVLLEINQDRTILGGVRLSFNGRYRDLSLAAALEQTLVRERKNLSGKLKLIPDSQK